ncbi:hypothetical protein cyc_00829 [Cyclospora cayetanensis]|uniref:Uncharacterized protein n=1 Tax=Cyclospora cayetanensis TaxID=88456 RepID=A0A1D3CT40_9EIME|nr:hypothetical protein cyc_00829 [Cyclospora cayetanensis]
MKHRHEDPPSQENERGQETQCKHQQRQEQGHQQNLEKRIETSGIIPVVQSHSADTPASKSDTWKLAVSSLPPETLLVWTAAPRIRSQATAAAVQRRKDLSKPPDELSEQEIAHEEEAFRNIGGASYCLLRIRGGTALDCCSNALRLPYRHGLVSDGASMRQLLLAEEERTAFFCPRRLPLVLQRLSRSAMPLNTSSRAAALAAAEGLCASPAASASRTPSAVQHNVHPAESSASLAAPATATACLPRGVCPRLAALRALAYWCCCCTLAQQKATNELQRRRQRQQSLFQPEKQEQLLHAAAAVSCSFDRGMSFQATELSRGTATTAATTATAAATVALEACEKDLEALVLQHVSECDLLEKHWKHEQKQLVQQQLRMFKDVATDLYLLQHGADAAASGAACQKLVLPPLPSAGETDNSEPTGDPAQHFPRDGRDSPRVKGTVFAAYAPDAVAAEGETASPRPPAAAARTQAVELVDPLRGVSNSAEQNGLVADFFPPTASGSEHLQVEEGRGVLSAGEWLSLTGRGESGGCCEGPSEDWPGGSSSYCYVDVRSMRGSSNPFSFGGCGCLGRSEPVQGKGRGVDVPCDDLFAALQSGSQSTLSGAVLPTGVYLQESCACIRSGNEAPDLLLPSLEEQRRLLQVAVHSVRHQNTDTATSSLSNNQRVVLKPGEVFVSRHSAGSRPQVCFHLAVAFPGQRHDGSQPCNADTAAGDANTTVLGTHSGSNNRGKGAELECLSAPVCEGLRQVLWLCEQHAVGAVLVPLLLLETEGLASCLPFALLQRRMLAVLRCLLTELKAVALSPGSSSCCSSEATANRLKHLVLLLPPIQPHQQQQEGTVQMDLLVQAAVNFLRNSACCC